VYRRVRIAYYVFKDQSVLPGHVQHKKEIQMEIKEIDFETLEGCDEAFEALTACACCGTQGGMMCNCGPRR
jgi:hypothetical protein